MKNLATLYYRQPHRLQLLLVLVALTVTAACINIDPLRLPIQPQSPPPGVLNTPLMDNRWRVEQVTYQGEALAFEVVAPQYITFTSDGGLNISSPRCPGSEGGYTVIYQGAQRYQLAHSMFAGVDCGEWLFQNDPTIDCVMLAGIEVNEQACIQAINAQLGGVVKTLTATHEYELRDDALILRGEGAEMRLVLDNP